MPFDVVLSLHQCGPQTTAVAPPGNMLELQILRTLPRPTDSDALGARPRDLCFNKPSKWVWCGLRFKNQCRPLNGPEFLCSWSFLSPFCGFGFPSICSGVITNFCPPSMPLLVSLPSNLLYLIPYRLRNQLSQLLKIMCKTQIHRIEWVKNCIKTAEAPHEQSAQSENTDFEYLHWLFRGFSAYFLHGTVFTCFYSGWVAAVAE